MFVTLYACMCMHVCSFVFGLGFCALFLLGMQCIYECCSVCLFAHMCRMCFLYVACESVLLLVCYVFEKFKDVTPSLFSFLVVVFFSWKQGRVAGGG